VANRLRELAQGIRCPENFGARGRPRRLWSRCKLKGYVKESLPSVRTMRDILNRMGYRLKRIQKAKPLKKTKETNAIFANVKAVHEQVKNDPETLEISMDTKAKVHEGDYARGGKKPAVMRRARRPKPGIMIRRPSANGRRWAAWCWHRQL
jgi:hypothetical protein